MSFSSGVKDELSRHISNSRHCRIAEIAAILAVCGKIEMNQQRETILKLQTENAAVSRKYFTLLKKTFNINTEIGIARNPYLTKKSVYTIIVSKQEDVIRVLQTIKMAQIEEGKIWIAKQIDPVVVQKDCCKRAYIRGAFLAAGSISDPEKFYHFEIVCQSEDRARQLKDIINSFQIDAKIVARKKSYVVYIKEGNQIVEILGVMDASVALMNLENVRILKDMRNSVNRKVNCETANINKTVNAAVKQIEDIHFLDEKVGLDRLKDSLQEIARIRLQYPEATLKELGDMLSPPVGKSGVNHRLRKLTLMAEELRGDREEHYYD